MEIIFYHNMSDKRFLNKNITEQARVDNAILLDNNINVSAPHFRIKGITVNTYNYCYVPDFKRYYYINGVSAQYNNVYDISCDVDVLMSFKDSILNCRGILERSKNQGNVLIADNNYNINRVDDTITNLAFSGCELTTSSNATNCYLLLTFGGTNATGE